MPKVKPKRHVPVIDMTAMVDVAFLLLTFFILTTKFKAEEAVEVQSPSSISDTVLPETNVFTITVDSAGKAFVGFREIPTREAVLKSLIEDYGYNIDEQGQRYFVLQSSFGVPIADIPKWLNAPLEEMKHWDQKGIPYPYVTPDNPDAENELKRWIVWGRKANPQQNFAIKGDKNTPYEAVSDVISSVQDYNINKFYLVTNMEAPPAGFTGKKEE